MTPNPAMLQIVRLALTAGLALTLHAPTRAQTAEQTLQPFATLRAGYAAKDATLSASAYSDDATVTYAYKGSPREEYHGAAAIRSSFARTLAPLKPEWGVDINFKLEPIDGRADDRAGIYRILVDLGERKVANYGRFRVVLREVGGRWRFAQDFATSATQAEFEALLQPLLFVP